jgi:hypothetical protein
MSTIVTVRVRVILDRRTANVAGRTADPPTTILLIAGRATDGDGATTSSSVSACRDGPSSKATDIRVP